MGTLDEVSHRQSWPELAGTNWHTGTCVQHLVIVMVEREDEKPGQPQLNTDCTLCTVAIHYTN